MRIQHHLSIILLVAVIGAIVLATVVGVLLGGVERAARALGTATEQQQQVAVVRAQAGVIEDAVRRITTRSSEDSFAAIDRAIEQSAAHLEALREAPLAFGAEAVDQLIDALDRFRQQAAVRSAGIQHPDELEALLGLRHLR